MQGSASGSDPNDREGKDTVGTSGIQSPVGGDGADGKYRHGDDEVSHQEHGDGLVEAGLANHKSCTRFWPHI